MIKKLTIGLTMFVAVITAAFGVGYLTNAPPLAAPLDPKDPAVAARPYVVKMHARWCPVCMVTNGLWAALEEKYRGRVNFVVFDFTNAAAAAASQAEAGRLGIGKFFDERGGATGSISVLDAGTKAERAFM